MTVLFALLAAYYIPVFVIRAISLDQSYGKTPFYTREWFLRDLIPFYAWLRLSVLVLVTFYKILDNMFTQP
jgi:hypothetical protein